MKRRSFAICMICTVVMLLLCPSSWCMAADEVSEIPRGQDDLEWWKSTIAYEIYVKSFKDSDGDGIGDLNGITSELDYLKDLGVGIIWLTPCYVSPGADNGYDVADYYNIDPAYGTMEDMERLIEEAGRRDIRIVMDLVFNHTSIENEWFQVSRSGKDNEKSDWYIWRDPKEDGSAPTNWRSIFGGSAWEYDEMRGQYYLHTFLAEQPDLNWADPEVRQALADVANFWVEKGVGGFRMDAITYIKKPEVFLDGTADYDDGMVSIHTMTANTEGILDYLREFNSSVENGTDIFTIGEANGVPRSELPSWVGKNGVMDMIFEFSHFNIDRPDEMNWCETREWKLTEFKDIFTDNLNITKMIDGWYPVVLENHDQPRSIDHYLAAGADRAAGGKALATLLLTMKGTPFIMEGEELGFVNVTWPSINDYEDVSTRNHYIFALEQGYSEEEAMEGVHDYSRDSSRTPMQWDSSANAGFTTGTPWLPVYDDYAVYNAAAEKDDPGSVLSWYITLAGLRREHSELVDGEYREILHDDENIFAYTRENADAKATILINFSTEDVTFDASSIENAELIAGTNGQNTKGMLGPLEAVIYEGPGEVSPLQYGQESGISDTKGESQMYEAEEYSITKVKGDVDWKSIPELSVDHVLWTEDTGIRASGQLCYDDDDLYVHLSAVEKDIRAENTQPLSPVFEDSCLEFFFMLPDASNYFNFEINPNGCLNVQFGPSKADRFFQVRADAADYFDIHADRTPDGWEVFYKIPVEFIRFFYPQYSFAGDIRANVYKCGNKTVHTHYLAWNPVQSGSPNFHCPEYFGVMHFE